jgi:anaerobic ribonucleoside-triphosphate reductase activating protein
MGGEPLCEENRFLTLLVIKAVKEQLPDTKVYIWTGYLYDNLLKTCDSHLQEIFELSDYLIDGPFILAERDITLPMRGSRNQKIIPLH